MNKYKIYKKVIDDWDPIDLLYFAPKDEYDYEVKRIIELTTSNDNAETFGKIIYKVFMDSFGQNTFNKSLSECVIIAKKNLNNY